MIKNELIEKINNAISSRSEMVIIYSNSISKTAFMAKFVPDDIIIDDDANTLAGSYKIFSGENIYIFVPENLSYNEALCEYVCYNDQELIEIDFE